MTNDVELACEIMPQAIVEPIAETAIADKAVVTKAVVAKPIAIVAGEPFAAKPSDLFIPPDALQVFLQAFEGPLDLLLYLIRKHKFDIIDLPIFEITEQYMAYIEVMNELDLDMAAEYLLMAAILAEIKSRMLLPVKLELEDEEQDPRLALVEHLKEYERYKQAALDLDQLPRLDRNYQQAQVALADNLAPEVLPAQVELSQLFTAYAAVLKRVDTKVHHKIEREKLSTRARMSQIMAQLAQVEQLEFHQLFDVSEGRSGVVVSFIALLELAKERLISWQITTQSNQLIVFKHHDSNQD